MMPRSLFWKIVASFLTVVAVSLLVGTQVFYLSMQWLYVPEHRGFGQSFSRAIFFPVEKRIDSGADGGEIELKVEKAGERVRIVLADTGPGIPEEERAKVFERFYTGSETYGGTGLGLSIVKRLVTAHGGDVWLENRPGGGTRAIIEL
jgi:K+-sensing histidine kinase KdpD